jgi:hypothetical protein
VLLAVLFAGMLGEEAITVIVIERLLILDDWESDRLSASQRHDLMEIIEERHGRSSTDHEPALWRHGTR